MNTKLVDDVLTAIAIDIGVGETAMIPFKYGYLQGLVCSSPNVSEEIESLALKHGLLERSDVY
jgi:hypothetical protein